MRKTKKRVIDEPEYRVQDTNLPKAIICDLDGTLSLLNGRDPYIASECDKDKLNEPVANLISNLELILFYSQADMILIKIRQLLGSIHME